MAKQESQALLNVPFLTFTPVLDTPTTARHIKTDLRQADRDFKMSTTITITMLFVLFFLLPLAPVVQGAVFACSSGIKPTISNNDVDATTITEAIGAMFLALCVCVLVRGAWLGVQRRVQQLLCARRSEQLQQQGRPRIIYRRPTTATTATTQAEASSSSSSTSSTMTTDASLRAEEKAEDEEFLVPPQLMQRLDRLSMPHRAALKRAGSVSQRGEPRRNHRAAASPSSPSPSSTSSSSRPSPTPRSPIILAPPQPAGFSTRWGTRAKSAQAPTRPPCASPARVPGTPAGPTEAAPQGFKMAQFPELALMLARARRIERESLAAAVVPPPEKTSEVAMSSSSPCGLWSSMTSLAHTVGGVLSAVAATTSRCWASMRDLIPRKPAGTSSPSSSAPSSRPAVSASTRASSASNANTKISASTTCNPAGKSMSMSTGTGTGTRTVTGKSTSTGKSMITSTKESAICRRMEMERTKQDVIIAEIKKCTKRQSFKATTAAPARVEQRKRKKLVHEMSIEDLAKELETKLKLPSPRGSTSRPVTNPFTAPLPTMRFTPPLPPTPLFHFTPPMPQPPVPRIAPKRKHRDLEGLRKPSQDEQPKRKSFVDIFAVNCHKYIKAACM